MSYRCGIGGRLGRASGVGASEPVIICDGCGFERPVASKTFYAPPGWFLNGKPPPKWRGRRWIDDDGGARREDWCPDCKDKEE